MSVGRPQIARVYVWLTFLVAGVVFVQGFLFGAFYSERDSVFIDAHGIVGELSGYFGILVLIPLAFRAQFPRETRIGWWTVGWVALWNVQAHVFGYGIEDIRWSEMVHIPLAIFLILSGMYLATRAHQVVTAGLNSGIPAGPDESDAH